MPRVPKRITDDAIKVRQLSRDQFTRVAGEPRENGHSRCNSSSTRAGSLSSCSGRLNP